MIKHIIIGSALRATLCTALLAACAGAKEPGMSKTPEKVAPTRAPGSFEDELAFLGAHTQVVVLRSDDGQAQVAVAPAYQGRVMTSTAAGPTGKSYGYLHRPGIALGARTPHVTVLGGEDRFWLGPEGGPYALYFAPGAPFDLEHWQVPEPLDWGAWPVVAQSARELSFQQSMTLTNYAGTRFALRVDRTVRLLERDAIARALGRELGPSVRAVGFESDNCITNTGQLAWRKSTGLVSIWILGMFRPAPRATVVIPYVAGPERELGPIVEDAYFGAIPPERLRVADGVLYFRADGAARGKIGVPRPRARALAGSYEPAGRVLTLVQYSLPDADGARDYVRSLWTEQPEPYAGDVVNSYNDGPLAEDAPPLGPFYELESSSPAVELAPGASVRHLHRTIHLEAPEAELDEVARATLGVSLEAIVTSLP